MARIPTDAFEVYVSLGPDRSYQAVASKLGVAKRSITRLATRDHWQERLLQIEREAQERVREKLTESMEAINTRHLKMTRAVQAKALAALQALPLNTGMDAVRALDLAIKQERLILGEPNERTAVSVEDTIKREYQRWMGNDTCDGGWEPPAVALPPADDEDADP
jgi:transposase-like protein